MPCFSYTTKPWKESIPSFDPRHGRMALAARGYRPAIMEPYRSVIVCGHITVVAHHLTIPTETVNVNVRTFNLELLYLFVTIGTTFQASASRWIVSASVVGDQGWK